MIIGFFGFNGSGKTLSLVRELVHYDVVFANFFYKGPASRSQEVYLGFDSNDLFDSVKKFVDKTGIKVIRKKHLKIALAIDEAGLNFPARSWKNLTPREAYLFAQHRKLGIDFLYTAQTPVMVDRILRQVTSLSGWPSHMLAIHWIDYYEGFQKKKGFRLYPVFFWGPAYYKFYNTDEIIESTKIYFEDKK